TQWVLKIIQEKQVQYTDIIDLFQVQNVSKLYIQCNFFTDLGYEPEGKGVGGTIVGVVTGGDVINDLENLIEETVSAIFKGKDDFDLTTWLAEWKREL
ncbi:MAG: hypothetical protein AB7D27_08960, partial [Desulfomicrobium sp.]